eukprot:10952864-Ditylum_brightwellii.AAC.1
MFCQGSGHGFGSHGRICQMCCPLNWQNVSKCQSDVSHWAWYIMQNPQLFIQRTGRAAYALWSLAGLP